MFTKTIPLFKDYIKESLVQSNWRDYKKDTDLNINKEANDISQELIKMFGVQSASDLVFTSSDIAFGNDFMFFFDIVMSGHATQEEQKSLNMPGYIVYLVKYTDNDTDCPIVLVNVVCNDGQKYSHVFVKKDDFNKFDPDAVDTEEDENAQEDENGDENNGDENSSDTEDTSTDTTQSQDNGGQTQGQDTSTQSQASSQDTL